EKVMVTVCWSAAELIHHSFLNPEETTTAEKYYQQIDEMHRKFQQQRQKLVNRKGPIHDNARSHNTEPGLLNMNELSYE
ncbi:hypothetical protein Angca_006657, partial [Angiostrongylus cantonensis]